MQKKRVSKIPVARKPSSKARMRSLLIEKAASRRRALSDILGLSQVELLKREKALSIAFNKSDKIKKIDDVRRSREFGEFKAKFNPPQNEIQKRELEKYFTDISWILFERTLKQ